MFIFSQSTKIPPTKVVTHPQETQSATHQKHKQPSIKLVRVLYLMSLSFSWIIPVSGFLKYICHALNRVTVVKFLNLILGKLYV